MTERPLRVGIVTPGWGTAADDTGLPALADLVERLSVGHDVRIVSLRHPSRRPPYRLRGAVVRALGHGARAGLRGRATVLSDGVLAVLRWHRRRPFDVLHAFFADEAGAVAVAAGRLLRVPVVVSVLGGELVALPEIGYGAALGRGGRWTVSAALGGATLVTAGSAQLRDAAQSQARSRVLLLPLGVDVGLFAPAAAPGAATSMTIVHVGSLEPVKDQVTLLRAFARVADGGPDVQLELCGDGRLREALGRLAARLGVGDRVTFLGHVPRTALPDRYRAATLVCVSSRHEAQGMVAVEAAACGVPVVGTAVGSGLDLGDGSRTVPVRDATALAQALTELLGDPAARARMGAAGRRIAQERFDLDLTSAAVSDVYRSLAR